MGTAAAIVGAVAAVATTAYTVSGAGKPSLPDIPAAKPPPAPPPPPAPAPAPPTETEAGEGVAAARRKRQEQFGVAQTLLASPLGGGGRDLARPGSGKTLLGG